MTATVLQDNLMRTQNLVKDVSSEDARTGEIITACSAWPAVALEFQLARALSVHGAAPAPREHACFLLPSRGASGMSNPRRDFDVKQILRIRWRWFGHATSPPPGPEPLHEPLHELFSGGAGSSPGCEPPRSTTTSGSSDAATSTSGDRKLVESGGRVTTTVTTVTARSSACPRSASQHECGSAPRTSPAHSRSALDIGSASSEHGGANGSADGNQGDEENNNNNNAANAAAAVAVESDSSSCRAFTWL
ncbi:hypothetical protein NFI96_008653 [Prochilodus magdalenae]|nr:hypothetical protein NFI96_008653 [Prochilodus magdalenae]